MSRKSGYFICYRNIWQHPVFKNLLQASCWIYMISSASHQDKTLRFLDNSVFSDAKLNNSKFETDEF